MALQKTALLLASIIAFSTLPCLAADYDPNVVLNVDLMLVEIPFAQIPPAAKLGVNDVLHFASNPEKSKIITRHHAIVDNWTKHEVASTKTIFIRSADSAKPIETYNIMQEFEFQPAKARDIDKTYLDLKANISWCAQQPDANTLPKVSSLQLTTNTSGKAGQPAIISATQGETGMLYLIATVEEAKP